MVSQIDGFASMGVDGLKGLWERMFNDPQNFAWVVVGALPREKDLDRIFGDTIAMIEPRSRKNLFQSLSNKVGTLSV